METSKTKKRLTYLIGFLIMISSHYLLKDNSAAFSENSDLYASYNVRHAIVCMDELATVSYYRLNCPMCKALIAAVSDNSYSGFNK